MLKPDTTRLGPFDEEGTVRPRPSWVEGEPTHLLVDAWNVFIAGFRASDRLGSQGDPIGGALFLLRTVSEISQRYGATQVHIIWETDGSPRRRSIWNRYKHGANPARRANRSYGESEKDRSKNMLWQIGWVTKAMGLAGCKLYNVPRVEADDVISFLVRNTLRDERCVILSGDNDLWQLLECNRGVPPRVRVVDSHGVETTDEDLLEGWKIHSSNWALAKAFVGDRSDNIPGVKGLGWKRLSGVEPLNKPDCNLSQVWDWVDAQVHMMNGKTPQWLKALTRQANRRDVERNYKLTLLLSLDHDSSIICQNQFSVDWAASNIEWMKHLNSQGVLHPDWWHGLSCTSRRLK